MLNGRDNAGPHAINPPALAAKVKGGTQVLVTEGTQDPDVPASTIGPLVQAPVLAPAAISAIKQWAQPFATTS